MLMTQVDRYLAIRRAAGFALVPIEGYLRHFARFATARGETHVVATTAIAWATLAPSEAQRAYRLQTVVRFARFLHAEDPRHEMPPLGVFRGRRPRPTPYIFSDEDIQQLLQDVTADGLLIRETKFHKSRLLPLHATTRAALDRYLSRRHRMAGLDTHLFVTRRGGPLSRTVVTQTFHQILAAAGIPHAPGLRRPRLIDLRHTFAVRALEASPESRDAIGRHTLALTTYMGHTCVASTYGYLESTPQLMADIARSCEAFLYGGGS